MSEPWGRALTLEETGSRLTAAAEQFGVARFGSITQLDSLGVHTATAIRRDPVGESISVCTGKGGSEREALVGALAEALERFCAEPRDRVLVQFAAADDLEGQSLAPERFAGVEPTTNCLDWCLGWEFATGLPTWIPANAVFFPYLPSAGAERLFASQTTGLSCGSSILEASVFAALECIERDAYSRGLALASVAQGHRVPVVSDRSVRALLPDTIATFHARGIQFLVRDLTCDTKVPTYLCTIFDGAIGHYGVAARPEAWRAVTAAVEEACQSRLTDIQGAREDLTARAFYEEFDPWFIEPGSAETLEIEQGGAPSHASSLLSKLTHNLATLKNPTGIFLVDLSLPDIGIHVVRAIAPGLEVWAADQTRIGPRAAQWLSGEP